MSRINYTTLAKTILSDIILLDKETQLFSVSIKEQYVDSMTVAIKAYTNYVTDKLNANAAKIIDIRKILVNIFDEIKESLYDEAVEIMADTLRTEFNSARRREKYLRQKAKQEGKEYVSDLVRFENIDESKIEKEDDEEIYPSDEVNVLDLLNKQEAETFGQSEIDKKAENGIPSITISIDNDGEDTVDDVEITKTTDSSNIDKNENPFFNAIEQINTQTNVPKQPQPKKVLEPVEDYVFSIDAETITGNEYNIKYLKSDLVVYVLNINGNNKLTNIKPFKPTIISNISGTRDLIGKEGIGHIPTTYNKWTIRITIATDKDINEIIEEMKKIKTFSGADIKTRINYRVNNNGFVTII